MQFKGWDYVLYFILNINIKIKYGWVYSDCQDELGTVNQCNNDSTHRLAFPNNKYIFIQT